MEVTTITDDQTRKLLAIEEGQFADLKSEQIAPKSLTKTISAFSNSDGGELYIGIFEAQDKKTRVWSGFENQEAANAHVQVFEELFPLGTDFRYEFLRSHVGHGLVLHVEVSKTAAVSRASSGMPYIRRGAQNLPVDTPEKLKRLEYSKGINSFEIETVSAASAETILESDVTAEFIRDVVPTSTPETWMKKQTLIRGGVPTVAGILLFAEEPQAVLPKRCGVKIYRYKTDETEGFRQVLAFQPITVEGCAIKQIREAVEKTRKVTEQIPKIGAGVLESIKYPQETLHEIITNAVIHRDYSIADDIHIRIFDNRIEVQSPGRLPAHVTIHNLLEERFARNGAVVRILNKFTDPPNKDVGEGLNTAVRAMHELGFKAPEFKENENSVLVTIKHELLASPEETIMDWLETHPTIRNAEARKITHVTADYRIKSVFNCMEANGLIEQVSGTRTSSTQYQKKMVTKAAVEPSTGDLFSTK